MNGRPGLGIRLTAAMTGFALVGAGVYGHPQTVLAWRCNHDRCRVNARLYGKKSTTLCS